MTGRAEDEEGAAIGLCTQHDGVFRLVEVEGVVLVSERTAAAVARRRCGYSFAPSAPANRFGSGLGDSEAVVGVVVLNGGNPHPFHSATSVSARPDNAAERVQHQSRRTPQDRWRQRDRFHRPSYPLLTLTEPPSGETPF